MSESNPRIHRFDVRGASWLDVKLALRMLGKQPGLTLVAIFALGIGIPVGVLPLHIADALTMPPPVHDGDEIVIVRNYDLAELRPVMRSVYDFAQWREQLSSFEHLGLMQRRGSYNVFSEDGSVAPVDGAEFTASIFSLLGVPPLIGRPLTEADEAIGAPDVVVIGYDLWQSRLAGAPDIVGRTIQVGGVPRTVVGVMPREFQYPIRDQLWLPVRFDPLVHELGSGPAGWTVGRLADGVSLEEAQNELDFHGQRMANQSSETHAQLQPQVLPFTQVLTGTDSPEARVFVVIGQTLALLLLVLACGNVGILLLARAAVRAREFAVRTALGATRFRIISQLFIESLLLAVVATGVGLLILQAVVMWRGHLLTGLPFWVDFEVSLGTALFAISLAVVSAAVAGVIPALKATGRRVQASIRQANADGSGIRFGWGYSFLIVGEVAVALLLLTIGAAMAPTMLSDPGELGIPTEQYLYGSLWLPQVDAVAGNVRPDRPMIDEQVKVAHEELVSRLSQEPGLGPIAVATTLPGTSHRTRYIQIEGLPRAADAPAPAHLVQVAGVDVGYLEALGHPVVSGRNFNTSDLGEDRSAVIVNRGFVDRVLEGRNPVGRRLRYWTPGREPGPWSYEIVGVEGSLGMNGLGLNADQGVYHVVAPGEMHPLNFAVLVGSDPEAFIPRLREIASEIDASAQIQNAGALNNVPDPNRLLSKMGTYLFMLLAGIAIVLSGSCLYALMSFTVTERTRETGIRAALGAPPAKIVFLIGKRACLQLCVGVLIGTAVSAFVTSGFGGQAENAVLFQRSWPVTVSVVTVFVIGVGMLACAKPTSRALRIRPVEAMRPD